ncbi:MAG: hypothetical protein RRZ64_06955 [Rikenellaceae bacterium]
MRLFLTLPFLLLPLFLGAQDINKGRPRVTTTLSQDTMMIGDQPTITVTVDKDIAQIIAFPEFDGEIAPNIELIEQSKIDTLKQDKRRERLTRIYKFTTFEAGNYSIGGFPVMYIDKNIVDTIYSLDSIRFFVKTIAIDTTKDEIYTVKAPLKMPITWAEIQKYVWFSLLGLLILAALYYVIKRLRQNKSLLPQKPKLPPHILAINELEKIKKENLWQSGKVKLYYTRVTDVIRDYLGERFGVNAKEMTTDEILSIMEEQISKKGKDYQMLQELLRLSDLVKFAKLEPSPMDNQSAFDNAYYFIEVTKKDETAENNV